MPRPMTLARGSMSGAPAAVSSFSRAGCSDRGRPSRVADRVVDVAEPGVETGRSGSPGGGLRGRVLREERANALRGAPTG